VRNSATRMKPTLDVSRRWCRTSSERGEQRGAEALAARGIAVIDDDAVPGTRRSFAEDPRGNRLDFVDGRGWPDPSSERRYPTSENPTN